MVDHKRNTFCENYVTCVHEINENRIKKKKKLTSLLKWSENSYVFCECVFVKKHGMEVEVM